MASVSNKRGKITRGRKPLVKYKPLPRTPELAVLIAAKQLLEKLLEELNARES